MNAELPASAATADRMVIAAAVLSPFLLQLKPGLRAPVLLGGAFVSVGYGESRSLWCNQTLVREESFRVGSFPDPGLRRLLALPPPVSQSRRASR